MKKNVVTKINISQHSTAGFTRTHRKDNLSYVSGFTLIEALVAIFIFSLALVSLITITSRGVTGIAQARDQVTAQFLAQEGIEIVRNARDTDFLQTLPPTNASVSWLNNLSQCEFPDVCYISASNDIHALAQGSSLGLSVLNDGMYEAVSTSGVKFTRRIFYTQTNPNEIEVNSIVSWNNGATPREVHLVTTLTNWLNLP
jgi:Tfp pilus assembly protein PilV